MGPFSVTGQPNAMGGREVGALANQLAAHMDFAEEHRALVQTFWQAPSIPTGAGLKAVDLFAAAAKGAVKAIWIMATNPVVSMPNTEIVKQALKKCELVIVSDCVRSTDTTAYAQVLLPALAWGEKEGTVTNSERRISRQRAFLNAPGEAKADWWILSQVAQRLGYASHFNYRSVADIFREHAALSGYQNSGTRDFDLSGLAQLSDETYQTLKPIQWPVPLASASKKEDFLDPEGTPRFFSDKPFYTVTGKAQFVPTIPRLPPHLPDSELPLILNTGRIRDQWHTMTRTGKVARLLSHIAEPYVEIHPHDARVAQINEGSLVQVTSRQGQLVARARVSEAQQIGNIFVPMHWNLQTASCAKVNALVMSVTDPLSGQPEFKHTPVRIAPYQAAWQGFILSKQPISLPTDHINYWVNIFSGDCWRYELAGETAPSDWTAWVREHLGSESEWLEYQDRATGRYRSASIMAGRLAACIFIGQDEHLPSRGSLITFFAKDSLTTTERLNLLTGEPTQGQIDRGETVCSCFSVGRNTLIKAIREQGLTTPAQISELLKAGSNCGSCIPELKALIAELSSAPT